MFPREVFQPVNKILFVSFLLGSPGLWATTLLHCGKLVDVRAGNIRERVTVVVEGGRFKSVKAGYSTPTSAAEVVDLKSHSCMQRG